MMHATLNFGAIGRCACGAIGRRREHFNREPICSPCVRVRQGRSHVVSMRAEITTQLTVGKQTAAQRRARRELLA